MASKWRELLPHYLAMFGIYVVSVTLVALLTGQSNFWISVGIAVLIALGYPPAARRFDFAPDAWD